ncbi:MAG: RodZ domain-containing protein [Patescibacteria group bacterium]
MMAQTGFTRKKVESLTLGERLKKLRTDSRMSLPDIAKATKIQAKYIEYLENGEYEKLPADVYVRGFLRSYARYLNVEEQSFLRLYDGERNIQVNLGREKAPAIHPKTLSMFSFVVTPRSLLVALIVLIIGGVFIYLYQEFQSFAAVPRLVITDPAPGTVVQQSEIALHGKTDKGAQVTLNGEPVFVGSEGEFSEKLTLQQGLNTVTLVAVNRFNKEKIVTFSLEAQYAVSDPGQSGDLAARVAEGETFFIEVSSKDDKTSMTIEADGETVFQGVLPKGEKRRIEAKDKIFISSQNGENVFVSFRGAPVEPLLPAPGKADKIFFTGLGKNTEEGV